jgi:hypothetical protein
VAGLAIGWFARGAYHAETARIERIRVADAARDLSTTFEIELWSPRSGRKAQNTVCLLDGRHGQIIEGGTIYNRNSHVDFDHYHAGSFTCGIQGGDRGQLIDLGDASALERRSGGPPLTVLRWHDDALYAEGREQLAPDPVGPAPPPSKLQRWVAKVLRVPAMAAKARTDCAQVKPGHVYFVRIAARREPKEIVALFQVLAYEPARYVKIRCAQL